MSVFGLKIVFVFGTLKRLLGNCGILVGNLWKSPSDFWVPAEAGKHFVNIF